MAFSLPLQASSSSLVSSSGKKQGSKKRRKNSKKTPIVAVITTATTTQKKQVRFQLPSDSATVAAASATTTTTTTGYHPDSSRGRQQHCRTKGPSKRTAKNVLHNSTIWYTAKELKSFRTDIELTIQWMITKGILDDDTERGRDGRKIHYSKKKMKDEKAGMYLRMLYLEHYQHYPFCAQGVECRTPLGQLCKKKRRKEALRSVLTLQQQQQEQRNNTERSTQTTQMNKNNDDDDDDIVNRNAKALAHIYALSCQESCSLALHRGRRNAAVDKGRVATRSSSSSFLSSGTKEEEEQEPQPHWQQKKKKKMKREEQKKTTMLLRSSSITLAYQYHTFCDDMVSLLLLLNKSLLIGGKE